MEVNEAVMNRQVVLASRPNGVPQPDNFRIVETPAPIPGEGQILIRHTWLGLAPAARLRMGEDASYREPMAIGDVVYGQALGTVVESRASSLRLGDTVMSISGGWQEYSVATEAAVVKVDLQMAPPSLWLGALGTSGLTAYVGLIDVGQPRAGETVVVSAATGGVGSMVGQIARQLGCRVIGIAGGREKARHLTETFGFDGGIDYRAADFPASLQEACPKGIDVYFDNVGGAVRDAAWPLMNPDGRVVVCGLISEYNEARQPGPGWMEILSKRLTIRGFIMSDHLDRRDAFLRDVSGWYRAGGIRVLEDCSDGLERVVPAFIAMLTGRSLGKTVVRL
jgi:NADPH-dependent curcumin reductase CurA